MKKKNPAAVALGRMTSAKKAAAARKNGALGGAPRWISVNKALPRNKQKVIAKYKGVYDARIVTYWYDGVNSHFGDIKTLASQPATHWRPL